jgi:hypothetical protein
MSLSFVEFLLRVFSKTHPSKIFGRGSSTIVLGIYLKFKFPNLSEKLPGPSINSENLSIDDLPHVDKQDHGAIQPTQYNRDKPPSCNQRNSSFIFRYTTFCNSHLTVSYLRMQYSPSTIATIHFPHKRGLPYREKNPNIISIIRSVTL